MNFSKYAIKDITLMFNGTTKLPTLIKQVFTVSFLILVSVERDLPSD